MGVTVHQVAAGAAPRDAITNHLLASQALLRSHGYDSEIFAEHIHPELADAVHPAAEMAGEPGAAAILHYSINSAAFDLALDRYARTALHYHNITPAELLWRHAPAVAHQCALGRRGLARFVSAVDLCGADSLFNARELTALGAPDARVIGILRRDFAAAGPRVDRPVPAPEAPRLLFVGRGIPNKAQHDLILATAALHEAGCRATLVLAGAWGGGPAYERHCRDLAADLGVDGHVVFAGAVSDDELAEAYREADVFLCLSDHEGFCVPLLEAFDADLPVVAYRAGAVPETLGEGGLLLPSKEPSLVAETVLAVIADGSLRARMVAAGRERLRHFAADATGQRLLAFAAEVGS